MYVLEMHIYRIEECLKDMGGTGELTYESSKSSSSGVPRVEAISNPMDKSSIRLYIVVFYSQILPEGKKDNVDLKPKGCIRGG